MTAKETRQAIQKLLYVASDGTIGRLTLDALTHLSGLPDDSPWPVESSEPSATHEVIATSFADPADVRAFDYCKRVGGTDTYCFGKGDNGIGCWGDSTRQGSGPCCALPPEDWAQFGIEARGKLVIVSIEGVEKTIPQKDTMPHRANIKNGAGIDMNADAWALWGMEVPQKRSAVTWRWA